jgi:hypothetical protein
MPQSFEGGSNKGRSNRELDIPQNLLDANQIISFHWLLFRFGSSFLPGKTAGLERSVQELKML